MGKLEGGQESGEGLQPSLFNILLLWLVGGVLFITVVSLCRNYFAVIDGFGDNYAYVATASAIRHWSFQGLEVKHVWGLPYVMAAISLVTGVSDRVALLLVSVAGSLATIIPAYRLWGGWIAGFFAVINFDWWQRSLLGGAEPLFLGLLFGSFMAARAERWLSTALLASLSTLVRPVGLFALIAVGLILLRRGEFRTFLLATLIGLTIGGLYILPLAIHFGDALANVNSYRQADWDQGLLLGWPFQAIIKWTFLDPVPWTNLLLVWGWMVFILLAVIAMIATSRFRCFARNHPVETLFTAIYLIFLFSYNSSWARAIFPRLALPVAPLAVIALEAWIPKNQSILWIIGIVSSVLAAASAIGIRNVLHLIYH
jgi:hypothetical protein